KNNQLTGILIDKAMEVVKHKIPKFSKEQLTEALLVAEQKLIAVGLTSVDDAELTRYEIELIDELQQQNKLQLNVYAMISATPELLDYYLKKGLYKTEKLNVRSFKFYADGALGSRGACLLHPYSDAPNEYGLLMNTPEFYHKYALLIAEKGFQMNTHCIGDSANRLILNVYKEVLKTTNDKRWRIEHAQVIHPDDFKKFSEINVIPSIQPTHATSDMYWAKDRLGEERTKNAYAYQQLLSENGIVALGTDFPIEDISPIKTFYAAVFRKDVKGFPKDGFQLENSLSREQALKGMTIWAAISNFEENEKGSLEVGKKADFIILDKDIMKISAEKMLKTNVIQTFIDGKLVFTM
ncbi:MAG: amidohydrolase, partial [Flavobacteriales bacterium CG_4_10_14_0_8_um_filter_32_5]